MGKGRRRTGIRNERGKNLPVSLPGQQWSINQFTACFFLLLSFSQYLFRILWQNIAGWPALWAPVLDLWELDGWRAKTLKVPIMDRSNLGKLVSQVSSFPKNWKIGSIFDIPRSPLLLSSGRKTWEILRIFFVRGIFSDVTDTFFHHFFLPKKDVIWRPYRESDSLPRQKRCAKKITLTSQKRTTKS